MLNAGRRNKTKSSNKTKKRSKSSKPYPIPIFSNLHDLLDKCPVMLYTVIIKSDRRKEARQCIPISQLTTLPTNSEPNGKPRITYSNYLTNTPAQAIPAKLRTTLTACLTSTPPDRKTSKQALLNQSTANTHHTRPGSVIISREKELQ